MNVIKWLGLVGAVLCLLSCSGGKYADAKSAINDQTAATEKFVAAVEKADNGKAVAAAMNQYSKQLSNMLAQSKKLKAKYAGVNLQTAPELKAENERAQQVAMQFAGAFMKVNLKYGGDPDVRAAMAKWQETMAQMGKP
jgi:hypothetical protein